MIKLNKITDSALNKAELTHLIKFHDIIKSCDFTITGFKSNVFQISKKGKTSIEETESLVFKLTKCYDCYFKVDRLEELDFTDIYEERNVYHLPEINLY